MNVSRQYLFYSNEDDCDKLKTNIDIKRINNQYNTVLHCRCNTFYPTKLSLLVIISYERTQLNIKRLLHPIFFPR